MRSRINLLKSEEELMRLLRTYQEDRVIMFYTKLQVDAMVFAHYKMENGEISFDDETKRIVDTCRENIKQHQQTYYKDLFYQDAV